MLRMFAFAALYLACVSNALAQGVEPETGGESSPSTVEESNADRDRISQAARVKADSIETGEAGHPPVSPSDYVRPDAKKRFQNYLNNLGGPVALMHYTATAGILTLRNSPKEWGPRSDGFARRFGNVAAKNVVKSTTTYGLDELLKVDSTFYRSKNRSVTARLRNSIFSAVTARNRRGKRVIGIPVIAGGVLSEVTSSSGWYPSRYNYVHGLKGGAISIAVSAGTNLVKEFIWKQ